MVPVGTKVTVVEQPILVGSVGDNLYLEANPSRSQSIDVEINGEHAIKPLTDALKKIITDAAALSTEKIDWDAVKETLEERKGYPVIIASKKADKKSEPEAAPSKPAKVEFKYNYN